jgi:hypothetical protein
MRGAFVVELSRRPRWYRIPDPQKLGERLYWRNAIATLVVALARRDAVVDLAAFTPQQTDYVSRWRAGGTSAAGRNGRGSSFRRVARRVAPGAIQELYRGASRRRRERLGPPNFRPVDLDRLAEHID